MVIIKYHYINDCKGAVRHLKKYDTLSDFISEIESLLTDEPEDDEGDCIEKLHDDIEYWLGRWTSCSVRLDDIREAIWTWLDRQRSITASHYLNSQNARELNDWQRCCDFSNLNMRKEK